MFFLSDQNNKVHTTSRIKESSKCSSIMYSHISILLRLQFLYNNSLKMEVDTCKIERPPIVVYQVQHHPNYYCPTCSPTLHLMSAITSALNKFIVDIEIHDFPQKEITQLLIEII